MTARKPASAPSVTEGTQLRRATLAVAVVFFASGFGLANWASRIPQVKEILDLTDAQLGMAIMCLAIGSMLALPLSGLIVHRLGPTRVVVLMAAVFTVGLVGTGVAVILGPALLAVGLFVSGFGIAVWDVAMNVEGAAVERRRAVPVMPRFHAAFSVGTVAGAFLGALMNLVHVGVTPHLLVVAIACLAAVLLATRRFLPTVDEPRTHGARALRRAWREPRTLAIGLFVLALAFAEGAGMDWLAVTAVDSYRAPAAVASVAYGTFVLGVAVTRWFGTPILERFGRVASLRGGAVAAAAGALAVVFGGSLALFLVGALLWGAGIALGFPVGMSAAADDAAMAAPRVSVISTIGYVAFLAGPAAIGLVGEAATVRSALLLIPAALAIAFVAARATRPLPTGEPQARADRSG